MSESSLTKESFEKWYKSIGLKYVDQSLKSHDKFYNNAVQGKDLSFSLLNFQYLYFKYIDVSNYSKWIDPKKIPSESIDKFEQFSESDLNDMMGSIFCILGKKISSMTNKLDEFMTKETIKYCSPPRMIDSKKINIEPNLLFYILDKIAKIKVFDINNNGKNFIDNNKEIVERINRYFSLKHFHPNYVLNIKRSYNNFAAVSYWYDSTIIPYKYYLIIDLTIKAQDEKFEIIKEFLALYLKNYKEDFKLDSLKNLRKKSSITNKEKGIYSEYGDVYNEILRIAGKQNNAFENFRENFKPTFYIGDIRIETSKDFIRKKTVVIDDNPKIQIVLSHHYEEGNNKPDSKNKGYSIFIRTDDIEVSHENEVIEYITDKLKEDLLSEDFTNKLEDRKFKYSIESYKTFTINESIHKNEVSLDAEDRPMLEAEMTSDESDNTNKPLKVTDNNFGKIDIDIPNSVLIETANQIIHELKTLQYNIHIFESLMGYNSMEHIQKNQKSPNNRGKNNSHQKNQEPPTDRAKNHSTKIKKTIKSVFIGICIKNFFDNLTNPNREILEEIVDEVFKDKKTIDHLISEKIKRFVKDPQGISLKNMLWIVSQLNNIIEKYEECYIFIANDTLEYIENHSIIQLLSNYPTFFKEITDHIIKIFNDNALHHPIEKNKAVFFNNLALNLRANNLLPKQHGNEQSSSFLETIYNKIINSEDYYQTKLLKLFSEKTGIHTPRPQA